MEAKHTPGPWIVRPCGSGYAIDYNADQEQICDYVYELPDARLIAAAPVLLKALQMARYHVSISGTGEELAEVEAAIALATLDTNL